MDTALTPLLHTLEPLLALLRPHLLPYTATPPAFLQDFATSQLGPSCYTTLITSLDPASSPACTKLLISKTLGLGIVAMSAFVKLPQLFKLCSSRSPQGVSFAAYALETVAYLITLAYNTAAGNAASTYGEIAFLALQNVVVSLLLLEFAGRRSAAGAWVAAIAAGAYTLFTPGLLSSEQLALAQAATIPLALAAKVPQIWTIARQGSTGQLSAFAVFNYLLGSLARVFTTLAEVDDPLILWGFVAGAALNAVLAAQMVWYWNAGSGKGAAAAKAKKHYPGKGKGGVGKKRA
ncbi:hypothetical protein EDC01DRAFT_611654 [Geopyxis carbonaria]|nr:hypothetical protein EDC01DRAFT_611654 [Geopyxis carbonaria]